MTLLALLETKQTHLALLMALLQQEQGLLVQRQPDGQELAQLAAGKAQHYAVLERLEALRRDVQQQMGLGITPADATAAAEQAGCLELWQDIQAAARRAAHLNALNGILVQQSLEHNQRALNVLQEIAGNFVYGANGKPCIVRNSINSAV